MEKNIRELTCIVCPRGCSLKAELNEDGSVYAVSGNICKRGEAYAVTECTSPMRMVTSTVRCEGGEVISVKTSMPVPKGLIFDVMKEINSVIAKGDVMIGDVILEKVCGTDADIIATSSK